MSMSDIKLLLNGVDVRTLVHSKSIDCRKKISDSKKGVKLSLQHRKALSDSKIGKSWGTHTSASRKKISDAHKGKKKPPLTCEHRLKISKAMMNKKGKAVKTPMGKFQTIQLAAKAIGVGGKTIRSRIKRGVPGYAYA